jgi:hypothetical protein
MDHGEKVNNKNYTKKAMYFKKKGIILFALVEVELCHVWIK